MTRTVYAGMVADVTKRLARLEKKAERYGVPFSYSVGDEHPQTVNVYAFDYVNHAQYIERTYTVAAVDIDIECDGLVQANGWRVLAHIEHGENGNIVTAIGGADISPEWYTAPARCDHCSTTRARAYTFMVAHENGEVRQVGKTCLKDYTGILPSVAVMWAEVVDLFPEMDCTAEGWHETRAAVMYPTRTVLAHAYDEIRAHGYVKSAEHNNTRDAVTDKVSEEVAPSADGLKAADDMIAWLCACGAKDEANDAELRSLYALAFDENGYGDSEAQSRYYKRQNEIYRAWDRLGNLERGCVPLARSGYTKSSGFGRLCYIPVAYKKYIQRKAEAEAREAEMQKARKASAHVGNVGDRVEFVATKAEFVTSWETDFGRTFLYKFTDADGNVYVWFASGAFDEHNGVTVRGTIKKHDERDGVKQTVLTRCRIIERR